MLCNMIAKNKTQRRQVLIILNWKMASSMEREKQSAEDQENHRNLLNWSNNVQAMFLVIR